MLVVFSMMLFNLADKSDYTEVVIDWLFAMWGNKVNCNRTFWSSWVKSSLSKTDIPQTYIALEGANLIATFSLWRCDLQSRQDIFPWFGGLIVSENHRNKGHGILMQFEALKILRALGYREIHLFTDIVGYYEKTGWVFVEEIPDETGKMVRLYNRSTEIPLLLNKGEFYG